MRDVFSSLYPPETAKFQVVERLTMPGFPPEMSPPKDQPATAVRHFYGPRWLSDFKVTDGTVTDYLAFIDKLSPHGLYDMMVLAADELPKSSAADLSICTIEVLQQLGKWFLEFVGDAENIRRFNLEDGAFHFCYNYDRDTVDRESGMAEKRFHLHLNYWSGQELSKFSTVPYGQLRSLPWRRRLLDPLSFLGARIAFDVLDGKVAGIPLLVPDDDRDAREGLPAGLKLRFEDWSVLNDPLLPEILQSIHSRLMEVWGLISRAFTGTDAPPGAWHRHQLLPRPHIFDNIEALPGLSRTSKAGLHVLANTLRDVPADVMTFLKRRKWLRVRHLSMGGLNYSLGLYSQARNCAAQPLVHQRPVYLVVQTKLFADMGGAGISYMRDVPIVRIARGDGVFTPEQIQMRAAFHQSFLAYATERLQGLEGVTTGGKVTAL